MYKRLLLVLTLLAMGGSAFVASRTRAGSASEVLSPAQAACADNRQSSDEDQPYLQSVIADLRDEEGDSARLKALDQNEEHSLPALSSYEMVVGLNSDGDLMIPDAQSDEIDRVIVQQTPLPIPAANVAETQMAGDVGSYSVRLGNLSFSLN